MYWGIDLGGTKIEGVVLSPSGETLIRKRIPTEATKGYTHVLHQIRTLIEILESDVDAKTSIVGMGTPGSLDPHTQLLKNSNSTVLNGQPFLKDIKKVLNREVIIANDANCLALAETRIGVVQEIDPNAQTVFGIIMGTGVGGGIIINGKALNGAMGIAGEWGHNYLADEGGDCYCGKRGCVETILSGPALERFYDPERKSTLHEIYKRYQTGGDARAQATIDRLLHYFGLGISAVINILDPDVIVLGGGVGNIEELHTKGPEAVKPFVFNTYCHTKIVRPKWGDSAGVFGAAFLTEGM